VGAEGRTLAYRSGRFLERARDEAGRGSDGFRGFKVDFGHVEQLDGGHNARAGFHRYGGCLYLSADLRRVEGLVYEGRTYRMGEPAFTGALYVLRSTAFITGVLGPHTIWCHFASSGFAITAMAVLPAEHPMRRLLRPFTVAARELDFNAVNAIASADGIIMRGSAFTPRAFEGVLRHYMRDYHPFDTFPRRLERLGIPRHLANDAQYTFGHWGLKLHAVYEAFVRAYVDVYWDSDPAIAADAPLQAFFTEYEHLLPPMATNRLVTTEAPVHTRQQLVDFVCAFMWTVTATHEQTGWVADFVQTYTTAHVFAHDAPLEDKPAMMPDISSRLFVAVVEALTSRPGISLMQENITSGFARFFRDDLPPLIPEEFQVSLRRLHHEMAQRNAQGGVPFLTLDPKELDISVQV